MESRKVIWVFGILFLGLFGGENAGEGGSGGGRRRCRFQAIYNFGDSNSDTGGRSAAIEETPPPNGETFFGKPSGRYSDGRLIIDFIAEELGLPYLDAYLDSIGPNFRHGANFAQGGASILPGGYSPFHLGLQISQYTYSSSRASLPSISNLVATVCLLSHSCQVLARPQDFSKALYTFDIGQNDLYYGFTHTSEAQVLALIPKMLDAFSQAVNQLYKAGARFFWVHNTGPTGCLPYSVIYDQSKPGNLDKNGCVEPQNKVSQEFNKQLKDRVSQLRARLPQATFTYVDVYSAKQRLIINAKNYGFEDPHKFCCGGYYGFQLDCGKKGIVNGTTVYGNACADQSKHISWDGIHYSEAANLIVSKLILKGSMSEPPNSVAEACQNPKSA